MLCICYTYLFIYLFLPDMFEELSFGFLYGYLLSLALFIVQVNNLDIMVMPYN